VFGLLIKQALPFPGRVRRPPTDPVNAMLSFGYTLLHNDLHGACNVVGFDSYVGYLHADRYGRANLPLDLMEEFRPIVIDSVVREWTISQNNHYPGGISMHGCGKAG
jgi:CRISP-associated protein Cas1